jgi:adenylate cyclase class 2
LAEGGVETEVKIAVPDPSAERAALQRIGAELVRDREFEDNVLYDDAGGRLAAQGAVLRVRQVGERGVLTFKGPRHLSAAGVKSRMELETRVETPERLREILAALGYQPRFRYQKYRETWRYGGCEIVVDETPIGVFLEIEGAEADIHRAAQALGHGPGAYLTESYVALFFARGGRGDMVFADRQS